jgi:diaminohydroxyphosphoribosylaminopyrimidine deaminase/5-amino-6-(5-phosphoribosylamino)uracil reductase
MAGEAARGATAYVTLEPCSHHGQTPPCADALIDAGVSKVFVATTDPDPRVSGQGIARLKAAGIEVSVGLLADSANDLNAGFFTAKTMGRPLVTVKMATTIDGRIATNQGHSQWITGPQARAWGHQIRATHDAVLVGSRTVISDDPELTCRLPGLSDRQPVSIVVDGWLNIPNTSKLVQAAATRPVWILTNGKPDQKRVKQLEEFGLKVIPVESELDRAIDLPLAMTMLAQMGLTRVMVEGGARVVATFMHANLVDRLVWFRAPSIMGADGLAAVQPIGVEVLEAMPKFRLTDLCRVGDDVMETYTRA